MNPILSHILQTNEVVTAAGERLPLHSHLPQLEGELLQAWLRQYRPRRLIEIGLAYGVSALFISEAIDAWEIDHYHIIDAFQSSEWHNVGRHHLQQAGYWERVTWHEKLSELCLPQLVQAMVRFDFAFIDGWHTFDHVLVDFFYINQLLDVNGVVIFDDAHLPALQHLLAYIATYPCYERLTIPDEIATSVPLKVRKMMNVPLSRIVGFVKVAADERDGVWFKEFCDE